MRIIIIGGGIAGLSSYLFLRKHLPHDDQEEHSIVIYEAHDLQPYVDSIAVSSVGADEGTGGSGGRSGRGGDMGKAVNHLPNNIVAAERDRDREEPSSFTPEAIGSAIGISLNGLNVLSRLGGSDKIGNSSSSSNNSSDHQRQPASSSQLIAHLLRDSHPVHTWQMTSARGWKLIDVAMLPKQQREQQQKTQQAKPPREDGKEGISDHGTVSGIMISRQAFWRVLLAELVRVVGVQGVGEVVQKGRVKSVVWLTAVEKEGGRDYDDDDDGNRRRGGSGSGSVEVVFEDGRRDRADLVIGADGVRSTVRKAMFQQPRGDDAAAAAGGTGRGSETSEESNGAKQVNTNPASSTNSSGLLGWLLSLLSSSASRSTAHKEPDYISPHYEGLVGVGGFIPSSVLRSASPPHEPGNMGIVFGPNGFFGYGYITTSPDALPGRPTLETTPAQMEPGTRAVWWSTFGSTDENPYPVKTKSDVLLQAADGNTKTPRPRPWDFDHAAALEALLDRHRNWKDPTVQAILTHLERSASNPPSASDTDDRQDRSEFGTTVEGLYPTWTTPWLPTWHKTGVVLVGDAAHAMQPSSGQGACQALEDAETLARCLGHFLRRRRPPPPRRQHRDATTTAATSIAKSVERSLQTFEKVRVPRVKDIYDRSQRMGRNKQDMGVVGEMVMYAFFKLMGLVGGVFGDGGAMQRLLAYDLPAEVEKELAREDERV